MSQGWQKCDDPSCGYTTRQVPLTLQRGAPMCTSCFRAHLHPAVSRVTDFCFLIKQFPLLNHCVVHLSKAMNGTLNLKKGFYIIADTLISQQLYAELMFRSCWSKSHLYLFCLYPVYQYSDTALYTQLLYYSRLFDYEYALKNSKEEIKKRKLKN